MNHKTIRTALALLFVSLLITAPRAQQPAPIAAKESTEDRVALYQALLDLTNPWTVMCIAAHPDDEDGTSLIVMRRKYGAHTVSLFSTFGEGGQNAIGPELYEELGAIRARETMAAAEIQGSEPHFLGLKDFGYSKSFEETFQKWGHDEALRRMVLQIRKLRPDVIITNHSVTTNDHGHHQATARLELEAFDAAADPTKFPEQLKDGVTVWQVQRLFVRARGNAAQSPGGQGGGEQIVTIDPNERDPVRGTMFVEQALSALQKHATQGPWPKTFAEYANRFRAFSGQNASTGQLPLIRYRLEREAKGAETLPQNSRGFLVGLRSKSPRADAFYAATQGERLLDLVENRAQLFRTLAKLSNILEETYRNSKTTDEFGNSTESSRMFDRNSALLERAYAAATGISAKVSVEPSPVTPSSQLQARVQISNNGSSEVGVELNQILVGKPDDLALLRSPIPNRTLEKLPPGKSLSRVINYPVDTAHGLPQISIPHSEHLNDGLYSGYVLGVTASVNLNKTQGFLIHPRVSFDIAPQLDIASISPSPLIVTPRTANQPLIFNLHMVNHQAKDFTGKVSANNQSTNVSLPAGAAKDVQLSLPQGVSANSGELKFVVAGSAAVSRPVLISFSNALVTPNLHVAYIRGFDFSLPNALAALGVESKELSVDEVKTADLQKYTSIIVDNRVYESQPELIAANQKLLDYANAGGTLIVFYHKSDEWNPSEQRKRPQLAPYKLILGNERITDETAPITFIEPQHSLLNFPNKLGQEDFANWIQERGLYYPRDWDPQFHALLQSNDPGEAPLKGGLLVADYGRGHYIYSSMVWYRELRGGVPGAYRMLANMISYGAEGKR